MSAVATADAVPAGRVRRAARWLWRRPIVLAGLILIGSMVVLALASPIFATHDPIRLNPTQRLKPPSAEHWFGTDYYGRDTLSRGAGTSGTSKFNAASGSMTPWPTRLSTTAAGEWAVAVMRLIT